MSSQRIIVTAKDIDTKLINRALLTLRDWEFGEEPLWDTWKIVRTKEAATQLPDMRDVDKPPFQDFQQTEWQGVSIEEVEEFMLRKGKEGGQTSLFAVLDDKGVQDETIIIVKRRINPDAEKFLWLDEYQKTRLPWIEAHSMFCNLDLANMDFEDFVDEESRNSQGWYTYTPIEPAEHYAEYLSKRDEVVKELKKLDLA